MDLVNTLVLVGTIAVMILSCFTAYMNFRTMRLIKQTKEIQEEATRKKRWIS